jgi:LemA protein
MKIKAKAPGEVQKIGPRVAIARAGSGARRRSVGSLRALRRLAGGAAVLLLGATWMGAAELQSEGTSAGVATTEAAAVAIGVFAIVLAGAAAIYCSVIYKELSAMRKDLDRTIAEIDALLKREFELLPELVSLAGPYVLYESKVLRELSRLRSAWLVAWETADKWRVGEEARVALERLFAAAESYAALRADEGFVLLQAAVVGIERGIAVRRERYNAGAAIFNARIAETPAAWIAPYAGFTRCAIYAPGAGTDESARGASAGAAGSGAGDAPKTRTQAAGGSGGGSGGSR